ncbi:MAG: hypothetical protein QXO51_04885 [Halobacteria archaeon]
MTAPLHAPGGKLAPLREKAKLGSATYFDLGAWRRKQQGLPAMNADAPQPSP